MTRRNKLPEVLQSKTPDGGLVEEHPKVSFYF